jgi:SAM-dependent methyltransferase
MQCSNYMMENDEETKRLIVKTDVEVVKQQALWAGVQPGMRLVDVGCGPGITTHALNQLVQPGGSSLGFDLSGRRADYGNAHYASDTLRFEQRDALTPIEDFGQFDFAWIRFVLEYHHKNSFELVQNVDKIVKPGGILCLIDLDYNCLTHYGLSARMERALFQIMQNIEKRANFDAYVGRKLYAYLYDLGYQDIEVKVGAHHTIYGALKDSDDFNWTKKVEVAARQNYDFSEYPGGFEEFREEFQGFFASPRLFTYTPIISCRGRKPLS